MTILDFLQRFCERRRETVDQDDRRFQYIFAGVHAITAFLSGLYHQNLWIPAAAAKTLADHGNRFVIFFIWPVSVHSKGSRILLRAQSCICYMSVWFGWPSRLARRNLLTPFGLNHVALAKIMLADSALRRDMCRRDWSARGQ